MHLAARDNEAAVDNALGTLLGKALPICLEAVERIVRTPGQTPWPVQIVVRELDLAAYDAYLQDQLVDYAYPVELIEESTKDLPEVSEELLKQ